MPPKSLLASLLPFHTFFFTVFDLKLGSEIITWFAVLNKVAGLYGLLAAFTGGTLMQLSMYIYSVATIVVSAWGAKQIGEENPAKTLTYAHFYFLDHVISTLYTVYFGIVWYVYTPHDGRRVAHSAAQKAISDGAATGGEGSVLDDAERVRLALQVWNDERGFSTTVLVLAWLVKLYFIAVLYSYAMHLRRGTFRTILSQHQAAKAAASRRPGSQSISNSSGSGSGGGSNGYAYSHLRNSSMASNGTASGSASGMGMGGPDVLWEDENEGDTHHQMLYGSRDEEASGLSKGNR